MARYNELLGRGVRLAQAFRGALGLDEQEGVTTVAPEITPIFDLDQDPSWGFLKGERRGAGFGQLGVVAGQVNHIALVNPAGSGMIAIAWIDEVFGSTVDAVFLAMIRDTTLGTPTVVSTRAAVDSRVAFVSGGNLVCTVETQQAGAALTPRVDFKQIPVNNVRPQYRYGPYILSPGFGVMVFSSDNAAGQSTFASFEWIERPVYPGELTGAAE